jgi:hypothetical protein
MLTGNGEMFGTTREIRYALATCCFAIGTVTVTVSNVLRVLENNLELGNQLTCYGVQTETEVRAVKEELQAEGESTSEIELCHHMRKPECK